ncbi:hypothetical protein GPECTOR_33g553 [Gonium pectorale]|uniref:Uncharacterized protein n=1 Tax=Gonium pectorale TaxID=33097 RepID=A0A150GCU5_GONPE|nr:hypothetical protein GPECTOR_33g553 [Gonium pectorale]|eukprot:KXZ47671.1 hypothetical protein GPECTOR_33g553 [Gonium pectorale]
MSRRAIGTLLHRAARGAGLAAEELRLGSLGAARADVVGGADPACSARPEHLGCAGRGCAAPSPRADSGHHAAAAPSVGWGLLQDTPSASGLAATSSSSSARLLPRPTPAARFSTTAAATTTATEPAPVAPAAAEPASAPGPSSELLMRRGQLLDSLAACLAVQQLDSLLANERNRAAFDETLLVAALDTAHRLCGSAASAAATATGGGAAAASHLKSTADAATDVLTRLSELLIQLLSEPGALSPEGAVRCMRTLAVLRFNPGGDNAGLMTISAFYRETVLPRLDPARGRPPPELEMLAPLLLVDLYFAFARLFEVAARRDRELAAQLTAAAVREEEEAARAEADAEGGAGASTSASSPPSYAPPAAQTGDALAAGGAAAVGDTRLYDELSRLLAADGVLASLPSRHLGMLATAIATSRYYSYRVVDPLARATIRRLTAPPPPAAAAGAAGSDAGLAAPPAGVAVDAMAASTLANIVCCMGKVRHPDEALYDAAAQWLMARTAGGGPAGPQLGGGVEPHHLVDVAVAFARVKYDNTSGRSARFEPLLSALYQRLVALWQRGRSGQRPSLSSSSSSSSSSASAAVVPRHLSCALFAAARLEPQPPSLSALLDVAEADVVARPGEYQVRQLVNVLVAFRRLGSYRPALFSAACGVLTQRLEAVQSYSAEALVAAPPDASYIWGAPNYADAAWAVALAGHSREEPRLMELLAGRVAETAHYLGKACLVRAAQAFAVAEITDPRVFEALAQASQPQLMDMGPPFLAVLVDSFAEDYLARAADLLLPRMALTSPNSTSMMIWALANSMAVMDAVGLKLPHLQMRSHRPDMQAAAAQLAAAFRRHPATAAFPRCREHSVLQLLQELEAAAVAAGGGAGRGAGVGAAAAAEL